VSLTSAQSTGNRASPELVVQSIRAGIRAVYQPIVDLRTGRTVALEALARTAPGAPFNAPGPLFVAAKELGMVAELDMACRTAALRGALDASLPAGVSVFVKAEPTAIDAVPPAELRETIARARAAGLHLVLEVSERALTGNPSRLLVALASARRGGWSVAVDDVGVNPDSLALLPFVRPDVVKLDISLVQGTPTRRHGYVAAAVRTYAERTGAVVLAECIENDAHLQRAHALGASLGQGWRFGRPGPAPVLDAPVAPLAALPRPPTDTAPRTPFDAVHAGGARVETVTKAVLSSVSRHMEADALADTGRPVVLATFQRGERFTPETARHYERLARHCAFVVVFGEGMVRSPAPGVLGVPIVEDDPLAAQWSVVVVGPRYAAALVARDLGDRVDDNSRRFEYAVTHRAELVYPAAGTLMRRMVASVSSG